VLQAEWFCFEVLLQAYVGVLVRGLGMKTGGHCRQSGFVLGCCCRHMWECWLGACGWRQVGAAGRVFLF
jgi:hypothetical protein